MARPTLLAIARLLKTHGLKGEIEAKLVADSAESITPGRRFFLSPPLMGRDEVTIEQVRTKGDVFLLKLGGVDNVAEASKLSGSFLMLPTSELPPLGPDEYYHFDLVGIEVETTGGRKLGKIEEILETGANDVYLVRDEAGNEALIPAIKDVVKDVDLEAGRMVIEPLPGLLPGDEDED